MLELEMFGPAITLAHRRKRYLDENWHGGRARDQVGHLGLLHEDYEDDYGMQGPYAIQALVPEAFTGTCCVPIPAATLRERLPKALEIAKGHWGRSELPEGHPILRSFVDFVHLAERMEEAPPWEPIWVLAFWNNRPYSSLEGRLFLPRFAEESKPQPKAKPKSKAKAAA